jgi:hypothetical protein
LGKTRVKLGFSFPLSDAERFEASSVFAMSRLKTLPASALSKGQRFFVILMMLGAALSSSVGVLNALHESKDFQWSGERVLLHHVDPWALYLAGDPHHQFLMTQIPNYLPVLYVLIVPFGMLPLFYAKLLWALANVVFALVSAGAVGKMFGLSRRRSLVLICLMMMATPTRVSIGNGQQSLLVLVVWCLTMLSSRLSGRGAMLSGIAYFKYSFAPPLAFFLLFRRGVRAFVLSLIPVFSGLVLVWIWITGARQPMELVRLLIEPLAVAREGYRPSASDPNLMNVLEQLLRGHSPMLVNGIEIMFAMGFCVTISYFAFRRNPEGDVAWQMSLMAAMSYGLFKHHTYDAVVLILPLGFALARWQERPAKILFGLIGYLFFVERGLQAVHVPAVWIQVPAFIVLMMMIAMTYRLGGRRVVVETKVFAQTRLVVREFLHLVGAMARGSFVKRILADV